MNFDVLTIFPEMFDGFWQHGIIRRALENGKISARATNIRDFAEGRHKVTDDRPYGGGCGMVMKPEPLAGAIRASRKRLPRAKTILLTPQGRSFNQEIARELVKLKGLILVCGRYEGVDERIGYDFIDDEISIGDYVLTGGELGAMILIDAVTRLIPGILGGIDSAEKDSFSQDMLEHAHFTRPRMFEGREVPDVLLSGNHAAIETWRMETSMIRTFLKRPDLLKARSLSSSEIEILKKWCLEIEKIIQAQPVCGTDALSGGE
ncbi:MAG: tRNA (guanosine(37)-N1)-methyltransferase TrmD [Desulfobacteraceae bacterium 4572_123]|nr:MAG: tRNA (guanosine(37)-N1)-methyltransferase TrmD [Desulfobacteraceae bacterium 4572_123]